MEFPLSTWALNTTITTTTTNNNNNNNNNKFNNSRSLWEIFGLDFSYLFTLAVILVT
jgi:hypothetical protein